MTLFVYSIILSINLSEVCLPNILSIFDNLIVCFVLLFTHFSISFQSIIKKLHSRKVCLMVSIFVLHKGHRSESFIFIINNFSFVAVLRCKSLNCKYFWYVFLFILGIAVNACSIIVRDLARILKVPVQIRYFPKKCLS